MRFLNLFKFVRLIIFSFRTNQFWSFSDNAFGYDPIGGNFDVGGVQFQWNDGIFSITLSPRNAEGFKTAYFHAMASTSEFEVSTQVLKNQTLAARTYHNLDFAVNISVYINNYVNLCEFYINNMHYLNFRG